MKVTKVNNPASKTALNVAFGQLFAPADDKSKLLMRVKPVQFILNSTVLTDVINRGDVLVVDISKGTMFAMKGNTAIIDVDGSIEWCEKI